MQAVFFGTCTYIHNDVGPAAKLLTAFIYLQSAPLCDAELRFVDVDTGETITLRDTDVTIDLNYFFLPFY